MSEEELDFRIWNTAALARRLRCYIEDDFYDKAPARNAVFTAAANRLEDLEASSRVSASGSGTGVSEREKQELRREGFERGWMQCCDSFADVTRGRDRRGQEKSARLSARDAYPLPRVERPLRVTLSDGSVWSRDEARIGTLWRHNVGGKKESFAWGASSAVKMQAERTKDLAGDLRALARILSGETETVEDDGSSSLSAERSEKNNG